MLNLVKEAMPNSARVFLRRLRTKMALAKNANKSAGDVFGDIYRNNSWGSHLGIPAGTLYSGPGSDEIMGRPYADEIIKYVKANGIKSVVDLGCGDFRVGRLIASEGLRYTGVDVVEAVIAQNNATHGNDTVNFVCRDISKDELPDGELCLVREVFQHISNGQILAALNNMRKYKHVIITDNQCGEQGSLPINIDRPHGSASRASLGTELDITKPPFNVKGVQVIFEFHAPNTGQTNAVIRGFEFRN